MMLQCGAESEYFHGVSWKFWALLYCVCSFLAIGRGMESDLFFRARALVVR
jgi:hypothetical protein